MEKFLGIGMIFQVVACAVIGTRLLALARRTRGVQELTLGGAFLLLGALGYPLAVVARAGVIGDEMGQGVLLASALAAQDGAALCMVISTWRTFRPEANSLAFVASMVGVLLISTLLGQWAALGFAGSQDGGAWYYLGFSIRAGAFIWPAAESIRYVRLLKRRQALGLADAVVVDRFRLWSIATSSIVAGFGVFLAGRILGVNVATTPWVLGTTSVIGIVGGSCLWLAFFPPAPYLRWVRRRAPATPSQ